MIADNRGRRKPRAGVVDLPKQFRPILRPFLQQPGLLRDPVALRPTPLRPIGGEKQRVNANEIAINETRGLIVSLHGRSCAGVWVGEQRR